MKQGKSISFYIEVVVMLAISVLAIALLAGAFSRSDLHSRNAKRLSDAVTLAASGAESFLAAKDEDELFAVLNEADNASRAEGVTALYNDSLEPDANGLMKMVIEWDEQDGFANGTVTVYYNDEKIYDLETGAVKGAER